MYDKNLNEVFVRWAYVELKFKVANIRQTSAEIYCVIISIGSKARQCDHHIGLVSSLRLLNGFQMSIIGFQAIIGLMVSRQLRGLKNIF